MAALGKEREKEELPFRLFLQSEDKCIQLMTRGQVVITTTKCDDYKLIWRIEKYGKGDHLQENMREEKRDQI